MKKYWSAGFSLVEAIVAAGLVSGLALGMMQMTKVSMGQKTKQNTDLEASSLVNLMRSHLDNPKSCFNTFGNQSITDSTVDGIRDYRNTVVLAVNTKYTNLTLKTIALKSTDSFVTPNGIGFTNVYVTFRRPSNSAGTKVLTKKFKLWVSTDGSNKITKCSGIGTYSHNLWRRSYFNPDDILYQGGSVSVNGDTATANMDAHGTLQAATSDESKILLGGSSTTDYEFLMKSDRDLVFKNSESGDNVDIVTNVVKVNEEIRPAVGPTAPCTEEIVGAIRVHPTLGVVQFCGGNYTKWISFANE